MCTIDDDDDDEEDDDDDDHDEGDQDDYDYDNHDNQKWNTLPTFTCFKISPQIAHLSEKKTKKQAILPLLRGWLAWCLRDQGASQEPLFFWTTGA